MLRRWYRINAPSQQCTVLFSVKPLLHLKISLVHSYHSVLAREVAVHFFSSSEYKIQTYLLEAHECQGQTGVYASREPSTPILRSRLSVLHS